jgi:uncharacterized protein YndB with AHSA1/START domain
MAHVEKSIFINAPIEEVFDFVAEPNNLPKYDFMAVEVKERSEGPVGIGTTFIEVVKMPGGIKTNSPGRVTEYKRPHKLVKFGRFAQGTAKGTRRCPRTGNAVADFGSNKEGA